MRGLKGMNSSVTNTTLGIHSVIGESINTSPSIRGIGWRWLVVCGYVQVQGTWSVDWIAFFSSVQTPAFCCQQQPFPNPARCPPTEFCLPWSLPLISSGYTALTNLLQSFYYLAEMFVDPQCFNVACYKAPGLNVSRVRLRICKIRKPLLSPQPAQNGLFCLVASDKKRKRSEP